MSQRVPSAACKRKRKLVFYADALAQAGRMAAQSGVPCYPYRCVDCGYYHLSHNASGPRVPPPGGR